MDEARAVVIRPKFHKYFGEAERARMEEFLVKAAVFFTPTEQIQLCHDPKDDFLLELAVAGNADYLVTGDGDLLTLQTIRSTKIITLSRFRNILGQNSVA